MNDEFKLNYYFQLYKDRPCNCNKEFKDKFIKKHGEFKYLNELTLRILNYQVEKYGGRLTRIDVGRHIKATTKGERNGCNDENSGSNRYIKRYR